MKNKITIIGIDCAVDDKKVGLARATYSSGKVIIHEAITGKRGVVEETLCWINKANEPILLALDAPLGWPATMGRTLKEHGAGKSISTEPNKLFRRSTDRDIRKRICKQSLDVGANLIARTAYSALSLLNELRKRAKDPIPLAWDPTNLERLNAIEVYPAATLAAHFDKSAYPAHYKGRDKEGARSQIANKLSDKICLPGNKEKIVADDNILDAVLCVLAGADFLDGKAKAPEDRYIARKEGWIWLRVPERGCQ